MWRVRWFFWNKSKIIWNINLGRRTFYQELMKVFWRWDKVDWSLVKFLLPLVQMLLKCQYLIKTNDNILQFSECWNIYFVSRSWFGKNNNFNPTKFVKSKFLVPGYVIGGRIERRLRHKNGLLNRVLLRFQKVRSITNNKAPETTDFCYLPRWVSVVKVACIFAVARGFREC